MLIGNSKGQGRPLTFQPRSLILEVHQYITTPFSQKPLGQLNSNFIWRLLKLSGVNFEPNGNGHMTNMATTPIYGKNSLNLFFSGTKRPLALGLGM